MDSNQCQKHPLHLSYLPESQSLQVFLPCLPQALIYPLTVASKSTTTARHNAANKILKNMCEHSNTLVQQAMMVSLPRSSAAGERTASVSNTGLSEVSSSSVLLSLPSLVQVSEELIRVAILWHEMWHEGLEEASRLYFGERNVKGMFEVLEPLHAMMERGPQTLKETSFNQVWDKKTWRDMTQSLYQSPFPPAFVLT